MRYQLQPKVKNLVAAILLSLSVIIIFSLIFSNFRFFRGSNSDIVPVLGILIQSSSALIAIVFAFLIFISQTILGKYVSGVFDYIFTDNEFVFTFVFFTLATVVIAMSLWIYPIFYPIIDISIGLFIIEIVLLPFIFYAQSKLLSPKNIIERLLSKIKSVDYEKNQVEQFERFRVVFSTIFKLAENSEYDSSTYGLAELTKCAHECTKKEGTEFLFYSSLLPEYERIGVECFKFNPNISAFVNSQLNEMLQRLEKSSQQFIVANVGNQIALASYNIAKSVNGKPYANSTLISSYRLLQEFYVAKVSVDYGFATREDLQYISDLIRMMLNSQVPSYTIAGFELKLNIDRLVKAGKFEAIEPYLLTILNVLPMDGFVLNAYIWAILQSIPLNKKEIADRIILALERKFGKLNIQFTKTTNPSASSIKVLPNFQIQIEAGSEEISQKINWLKNENK